MSIFECKNCGGQLEIISDGIGKCTSCRSKQSIPNKRMDDIAVSYNRANGLRLKDCNFDDALRAYENILRDNPEEAEAYWGIVLCRYGIEYVKDRDDYKPTCHRTIEKSIKDDEDFRMACKYATEDARNYYMEQADMIDAIQARILSIVNNEKPYDIFISYKEKDDETGEQTLDSRYANSLYTGLIKEGYNVFYAKETLKDKIGVEYEPYIYAAMKSARVMLLIGTKREYFEAKWVKNEWRRFKEMARLDSTKRIFVAYAGMDPYELPEEIRSIQAADMSEMSFFTDILKNINSFMSEMGESLEERNIKYLSESLEKIGISTGSSVFAWMESGTSLLENGKYEAAQKDFEQAITVNPKYAMAYWNRLLAKLRCSEKSLVCKAIYIYEDEDYIKAVNFANEEERKHIEDIGKLCVNAFEIQKKYEREFTNLKNHYESMDVSSRDERISRRAKIKDEMPKVQEKMDKINIDVPLVLKLIAFAFNVVGMFIYIDSGLHHAISSKMGFEYSDWYMVLLVILPAITLIIDTSSLANSGLCFIASLVFLFVGAGILQESNEVFRYILCFTPLWGMAIYSVISTIVSIVRNVTYSKWKKIFTALDKEFTSINAQLEEEFNAESIKLYDSLNAEKINKSYKLLKIQM